MFELGQREETTEELSERVLARLRREYTLVSSEVWVDDAHRVDFVGFRPARNSPFPSSIERGEFEHVPRQRHRLRLYSHQLLPDLRAKFSEG